MRKEHTARGITDQGGKPASTPIRVLLCDDHEMFREGIAGRLAYLPDIEVVGEASEGAEAVKLARTLKPDVIIMDLAMPGMGGFEAIARIRAEDKQMRVLVLTGHDSDADVLGALEEGATGYVVKDSSSIELFKAIRQVARGLPHVSPNVASRLVRLHHSDPPTTLTEREVRILRMAAEGKTTKNIARSVHMAERTVKHYLERVCDKLGAENRSHAVALAVQRGLVRVDDR